jgi:large subunit ribosomal protein L17
MAISLFQHGAIRTTEAKAKELRGFVEKLITIAKNDTIAARRRVSGELGNRHGKRANDSRGKRQDTGRGRLFKVVDGFEVEELEQSLLDLIFTEIAPRYADRPGGYTRIIRLSERRIGDAGKQVVLQLVEESAAGGEPTGEGPSRRKRRAAKRHEAVDAIAAEDKPAAQASDESAGEADQQAEAQAEAPEQDPQDESAESGDEQKSE